MNEANLNIRAEVLSLLMRLPTPPEESLPGGVSDSAIIAFETSQRLTIPSCLREWLNTSNGPCVGPGGIVGLKTTRNSQNVEYILELYPVWAENGWVPIAGDGCGSYYVVVTQNDFGKGEPVVFVDVNDDNTAPAFIAASDTWRFLRFLFKKELGESNWPFAQEEVAINDPAIMSFSGVALPWEA
ncbi:MAG: SMI1/KNR4 family protein [Planctomycetes bacterium]|nr:SMI1/KNR4 family protein [Planctomycetota bacterium]